MSTDTPKAWLVTIHCLKLWIHSFCKSKILLFLVRIIQLGLWVVKEVTCWFIKHPRPHIKHVGSTCRFKCRWPLWLFRLRSGFLAAASVVVIIIIVVVSRTGRTVIVTSPPSTSIIPLPLTRLPVPTAGTSLIPRVVE